MAARLLTGVLAALLVQGCLIPQDDPLLPDLPPKRNTAPLLSDDSAAPAQQGRTLFLGDGCLPKDRPFQIGVKDPDLGDDIRSRWFVDDLNFTQPSVEGNQLPRPTSPERGIVTPLETLYASKLFSAGPHYVTVVVADREFIPGGIELKLETFDLPDGGSIPDSSKPAQHTWNVITDPSPCR